MSQKRDREEEEEEFTLLSNLVESWIPKIISQGEIRERDLKDLCHTRLIELFRYGGIPIQEYLFASNKEDSVDRVVEALSINDEKAKEFLGYSDEEFYDSILYQWQGETAFRIRELTDPSLPYFYTPNIAHHQMLRQFPDDDTKNSEYLEMQRQAFFEDKPQTKVRENYIRTKQLEIVLSYAPKDEEKSLVFENDIKDMLESSKLESKEFEETLKAKYPKIRKIKNFFR